jgi:bacillolysin
LFIIAFFTVVQAMAQESEELIMPNDPFIKKNAVKLENKNWIYLHEDVDAKAILKELSRPEGKQKLFLNEEDELLTKNGLKIGQADMLKLSGSDSVVRFEQWHNGIAVEGAQLLLHYKSNGKAKLLHGKLAKNLPKKEKKSIAVADALAVALAEVNADKYAWEDPNWEQQRRLDTGDSTASYFPGEELIYARINHGGNFKANNYALSYRFVINTILPEADQLEVIVDAKKGNIIRVRSLVHHDGPATGTLTTLYNGQHSFTTYRRSFPNYDWVLKDHTRGNKLHTLAYTGSNTWWTLSEVDDSDNKWSGDAANTHWAVQKAWDYFGNRHYRNGTDNNGEKIRIGYALSGENAFYKRDGGYDYLVFGKTSSGKHLSTLDIVGHEFAHGVTNHSAGLVYQGESGALNESFSDIFGTMVESYIEGGINWTMGEDANFIIRSLQNPNSYGHPDTYAGSNWINPSSTYDHGGVHINSGVQNHWFYLLVTGGSGVNDNGQSYSVQGIGAINAAKIAYRNLTQYLTSSSNYADARQGAINAAIALFGECSAQHIATVNAWHAVGVGAAYTNFCVSSLRATATDFCMEYGSYSSKFSLDVFPTTAKITWYVPSGWSYYLSNSNKTLNLTGISNPYPGTYTIRATVSSGGQTISRYQYVRIEKCFDSGCEPQMQVNGGESLNGTSGRFEQEMISVQRIPEPCMMEAAQFVDANIQNEQHRAITAQLLNQVQQGDFQAENSFGEEDALNFKGKLVAYPNPSRDKVVLEIPGGKSLENYTMKIMNTMGQVLITQQLASDRTVNVASLESGTYLVYLVDGEKHYTTKLIISK